MITDNCANATAKANEIAAALRRDWMALFRERCKLHTKTLENNTHSSTYHKDIDGSCERDVLL